MFRLNIPQSFGVKESDFRFHILFQCFIRINTRSAPVGKHSDETAPSLLERRFADTAPHNEIHLNVTSHFFGSKRHLTFIESYVHFIISINPRRACAQRWFL